MTRISSLSQKYIRAKGEDRQEISMITAMVREIIKIYIGQIVEIGKYCSVTEFNMDRIIETNQGIIRTIEVILAEEILEGISHQIRITEVKIMEVDIEEIMEMIIMKEAKVGLGMAIPIIEGTIGATLGLDHFQDSVPIEIELDVKNAGNTIILLKISDFKVEKESEQIQQMYNMDEEQTTLKLLATDTYDSLN